MAIALAGLCQAADLETIKKEPNLERRAGKAMDYAEQSLKAAQNTYLVKNDLAQTNHSLEQMRAAVELAYQSLVDTGKNPSKRPRHFKRAEIRSRELLRRLTDFRDKMSFDDRAVLDQARSAIEKVHDDLLAGIMGGKKKT